MNNIIKKDGITLIALTVTIVVLLIISGVTVSQIIGSGVIKQVTTAKDDTNKAEEKEILRTSVITALGKSSRAKVEEAHLKVNFEKNIGEEGKDYTIIKVQEEDGSKHFNIEFLKSKNQYTILEDGTVLDRNDYEGDITTDSEELLVIEVGETTTITVETNSNDPVTWKSTNESAAEVKVEDIRNTHTATIRGVANCDELTIVASLSNGKKIERKVKVQTSPKSITITNKNKVTINLGSGVDFVQLQTKIEPDTVNVNQNLTWKSSDNKIAKVDQNGRVVGLANGTVIITVTTQNGKEDSCSVLVQTSPKSIKLNPETITLDKSGTNTQILSVSFEPSYSNIENAISWSCSDTSKVAITEVKDEKGSTNGKIMVTGKANGTVKITATTANKKSTTATVIVQTTPKSISLVPNSLNLDMSGTASKKLEVSFVPQDSNTKNGITWTSSNPSIATVDNYGNVTAKANGDTVIKGRTENGKEASCNVHVQTSLKTISLNKTKLSFDMSSGSKSERLNVRLNPSTANVNTGITWSSSNTNVATVDGNGNVTAVGNGGATITAKAQNGSTATCSVGVIRSIVSLSVSPSSSKIFVNGTVQLSKSINPSNTTEGTIWTSSNTNVATVNSNGLVTGKNEGTATITLKNSNGNKYATCQIKVIGYRTFSISRSFWTTGEVNAGWHVCQGEVSFGEARNIVSISGWGKVGETGMWDEVKFGLRIRAYNGSSWETLWEDYESIYRWWGERGEMYRDISLSLNKKYTMLSCDFYNDKWIDKNWWADDPRDSSFGLTVTYYND